MILMVVGLVAVTYFMMIRPQQKRRREAEQMQSRLTVGDEVVTIGGLYGTVAGHDDETVTIEAHPDVLLRFARPAIARVVTRADAPEAEEAVAVADETPADSQRASLDSKDVVKE
ncbi:preprotein translocase subunit YajC [Catenuloplanes atrovinosus]|nr:preprotein translocase subunit YajC [Catenuloplanes atrovinosus]